MNEPITYEKSGVDIDKADAMKRGLSETLRTSNQRVLNSVGAFSSLFDLSGFPGISEPVLCLKMEEPGSKQLLAAQHGRLAGVGRDLVNHLINDTVMNGGRPLAILDTIVCGELIGAEVAELIRVMAEAADEQECTLVGGETSEQPRVIDPGTYILSAACIGLVDKSKLITGETISAGDVVYSVASNGVHTNGYTLIRSLLDAQPDLAQVELDSGRSFIDEVLLPHRCYNTPLQTAFDHLQINGLAHITGGGVHDNLRRILPPAVDAQIDLGALQIPEVFRVIQARGDVPRDDMLRTFNCGVGMIFVASEEQAKEAARIFGEHEMASYPIGKIVAGSGQVQCAGQLALG